MVSLLSRITARGVGVPVMDKRLLSHIDYREVVKTDDGPAAQALRSIEEAPAKQASSSTQTTASSDGIPTDGLSGSTNETVV